MLTIAIVNKILIKFFYNWLINFYWLLFFFKYGFLCFVNPFFVHVLKHKSHNTLSFDSTIWFEIWLDWDELESTISLLNTNGNCRLSSKVTGTSINCKAGGGTANFCGGCNVWQVASSKLVFWERILVSSISLKKISSMSVGLILSTKVSLFYSSLSSELSDIGGGSDSSSALDIKSFIKSKGVKDFFTQ